MKKIYLMVLTVFIISLFLFLVSFVYLDKHNHRTFYYSIFTDGQYTGGVKIDKFMTEEKLVFKSVAMTPFREFVTEKRTRLDLDRRYNLEDYEKDTFANGSSSLFYAENRDDSVSFLARSMSRFSSLGKIHIRRGTFVFEEDSPVTYLPIIENYDLQAGGAQGFNSLVYLSDNRAIPMKRFVTLTAIKDEYLKIERRKIATVNMLVKIKGLPPGNIWVARSDKSLVMIDIPSIGLKAIRSFEPREKMPQRRAVIPDGYISRDVAFYSKSRQLSGTLTEPSEGGVYPAVLLIWGAGAQDRDYQGFFQSIAEYLPKYGYSVLRFDKRGIGSSAGDSLSTTPDDELDDIEAALNFLKSQKNVNTNRISVIGHSEGALPALRLAAGNPDIKGIILMAPVINVEGADEEAALRDRAAREKWDSDYLALILRALQETREKVEGVKHDWGYVLGKKCYFKNMRVEEAIRPAEAIEKIASPVLIVQGKMDTEVPTECALRLDKALASHGKIKHSAVYFDHLGHFFGKLNNDGLSKMYYSVDKDVLAAIRDWLNLNTVELASPEARAPSV